MRLSAIILAVVAVLMLGRVLYEFVQFGLFAPLAFVLGVACAVAAVLLHRRAAA